MIVLHFEAVADRLWILKTPFSTVFSAVILVEGNENYLIDSGADTETVNGCILPALAERGLRPCDIKGLLCTHCHGDHTGGHERLAVGLGIPVLATAEQAKKLADPDFYARKTRTVFPEHSPKPRTGATPIPVARIIRDGQKIGNRLTVLETPGHDTECVSFLDTETGTLITGDSLQCNGTPTQGIGFYKDLPAYRRTLQLIRGLGVSRLIAGHEYDGMGCVINGADHVRQALAASGEMPDRYTAFIREALAKGETDPAVLADRLIRQYGCGQPEYLFMAMYTVAEHIKEINSGEVRTEEKQI